MGSRSVHFVLSTSLTANTAQFSPKRWNIWGHFDS